MKGEELRRYEEELRVQNAALVVARARIDEQERVRQEIRSREREAESNRYSQQESDERDARRLFLRNAGVWCPREYP
jgi:hypothetical protein